MQQQRSHRPSIKALPYMSRSANVQQQRLTSRASAWLQAAQQYPAVQQMQQAPLTNRGWVNDGSEVKYSDLASANYACDTTGSVTCLNAVPRGDAPTSRNGNVINMKSCRVFGLIYPQDYNVAPNLARIMLVWDAQPNSGSLPSITDILNASTSISSTNLNNRMRFTILRDYKTSLAAISIGGAAQTNFAGSPTVDELDWYVKIPQRTYYSGNDALYSTIATGALLLVTIGNQPVNDGSAALLTTRIRFTDP